MSLTSATEPLCQSKHETITGTERHRVATDGEKVAKNEHNEQETGYICAHWLHRLPKVWLERDALDHLVECEAPNVRRTADASRQQRSQTRACQQRPYQDARFTGEPLPPNLPIDPEDIKRFARQGGPDLSDLRGHPASEPDCVPIMSPRRPLTKRRRDDSNQAFPPRSTSRTTSRARSRARPLSNTTTPSSGVTKSRGAYGRNFESFMCMSGIYPEGASLANRKLQPKPGNFKSLRDMLQRRRSSVSSSKFTEKDFERFQQVQFNVRDSESKIIHDVIPYIQGPYVDDDCVQMDMLFNNSANLLDNSESYMPKPDLYYGAHPDQLDVRVREELNSHIAPSTINTRPIAPNNFIEAKSALGTRAVARRQMGMAGAVAARAMHSLQTYGGDKNVYDNNAYALSNIYIDGTLSLYSHHVTQPKGPKATPEYYMHCLRHYSLTDDRESAAAGIAAFRNAKDWTEKQRIAMIKRANAAARKAVQAPKDTTRKDDRVIHAQEDAETSSSEGDHIDSAV